MASYNGAKYIHSQLVSILSQLGPLDEVVIVDDASRDSTAEIIKSFSDRRIRLVINERNLGPIISFGRAIELAAGDIVFLSDQDDVWHPAKVRTVLSAFAADPDLTLVLSNAQVIDAGGNLLNASFQDASRFRPSILATIIKNRYHGCCMAFRRFVGEAALPFPSGIPMHDSWIGLVNTLIGKARFIDENLIYYRRHGATVTGRKRLTTRVRLLHRWHLCKNLVFRALELRRRKDFAELGAAPRIQRMKRNTSPCTALIVAPFFSAELVTNRPMMVASALSELLETDVLTTDFDHARKCRRPHLQREPIRNIIYLRAVRYRSNVGVMRFVSHILFAAKAAKYVRQHLQEYDVIYATAPFNLLSVLVFLISGARPKILDVIDIWPDVLPFPPRVRLILAPLFSIWKWLFRFAVKRADIVLSVSDSFLEQCASGGMKLGRRFYIGHPALPKMPKEKDSRFTIAYVGNLGRLYDFETLVSALSHSNVREQVAVAIIGEGDRKEWLLRELAARGIRYEFFGTVYDSEKLSRILAPCHAGFNGYINTSAAFSYKANTYFAANLPILNSMEGDLKRLVERHGLGKNYLGGDAADLLRCIEELIDGDASAMAPNVAAFFANELESSRIVSQMIAFLSANLGLPLRIGAESARSAASAPLAAAPQR